MERPKLLTASVFAFAVACLGSSPAAAASTTLTTVPAQPSTLDEITVHIETSDVPELMVQSVTRVNEYYVQIRLQICPHAICPVMDQVFDVPIGTLPRGNYSVQAFVEEGPWGASIPLTVVQGTAAPPAHRFDLAVSPAAPTDGETTELFFNTDSPACAPAALDGWTRDGNRFVAHLAIPEPDPACLPPEGAGTVLGGGSLEVGQLEPGAYLAELRDAADGALLASKPFTVADAGDAVTLLGRYRVAMTWQTADGQTGAARPIAAGSPESALFSFFNLANWEVLVKVLDGCAINGHRWIFLAAATDVEFTLTITDLEGAAPPYVHLNPAGLNVPLADTAAFACTP
jgi:hypothetical protein